MLLGLDCDQFFHDSFHSSVKFGCARQYISDYMMLFEALDFQLLTEYKIMNAEHHLFSFYRGNCKSDKIVSDNHQELLICYIHYGYYLGVTHALLISRTNAVKMCLSVLMDDHKEDEAIAELTKAIAFKTDLQLFHLRAAFHDSMGDNISTVRDCEAALCLDPSHADTIELYHKALERAKEQQQT